MSETICINKKLWDQTRALLEERKIAINALEKVVTEHGKTIGEQRNELADQRRTIATLRARLQNRKEAQAKRYAEIKLHTLELQRKLIAELAGGK